MVQDLFKTNISRATVVTLYLRQDVNLRLRPKILDLRPGTRIVSNTFTMGEWEADDTATIGGCDSWCTALFWIVPAKVEGTWRLPQGELALKQEFQMISGTLSSDGKSTPVKGRLNGNQISFSADGVQYTGRVRGNSIEGTVKGGKGGKWTATRAASRS